MNYLLIFFVYFISSGGSAQPENVPFEGKSGEAPYHLGIPKGWDTERFLLPGSFAPEIKYRGVEDIRFTPGWGNPASAEYWTDAFLWYLDNNPKINARIAARNLKSYDAGLVGSNIEQRKITQEKLVTVKTRLKK